MIFNSRRHAGQLLAEELSRRDVKPDLVYGLARGGVAVAAEIAAGFKTPLEPLIVRKISPPGNPEFALGAVAALPGCEPSVEGSHPGIFVWWNEGAIRRLHLPVEWQKQQIKDKKIEISNYLSQISFTENVARSGSKLSNIVLVDDGAATGATMLAALSAAKTPLGGVAAIKSIVALPVASADAAAKIRQQADETVILSVDSDFRAVGQFYREFSQVSWDEVKTLLQSNNEAYRKIHPRKTSPKHD